MANGECKKRISAKDAVRMIHKGDRLLVGGFGICGTPFTIIDTITESDHARELTIISNNLGEAGKGLGKLLISKHINKAVGSYFTTNRDAVKAWNNGDLEIEIIPQGTLAEAIRAGGAGIAGFYTKTGVGTEIAIGKEEREFDGERFLFVRGIRAKIALIKADKADTMGNLVYAKTARNFNPMMATAAEIVIAEVDEIVNAGELDPEQIVTPHNYVDFIVLNDRYKKIGGEYVERRKESSSGQD